MPKVVLVAHKPPSAPDISLSNIHHFYMPNAQGNVRVVLGTGAATSIKSVFAYGAYGGRSCVIPSHNGHCDVEPSLGYTGQYQDAESELVYLRARYYDPLTQQFLSRDPLEEVTGQPYAYAGGNPVNFMNPTGGIPSPTSWLLQTGGKDKYPPGAVTGSGAGAGGRGAASGPGVGPAQTKQAAQTASGRVWASTHKGARTKPSNYEYRGKVFELKDPALLKKYPKGVRFTEDGFPDFSPYAVYSVKIKMKGGRGDFRRANKAVGRRGEDPPPGYIWHHHEDRTTMQLVPSDLHDAVRHTGGEALIKRSGRLP